MDAHTARRLNQPAARASSAQVFGLGWGAMKNRVIRAALGFISVGLFLVATERRALAVPLNGGCDETGCWYGGATGTVTTYNNEAVPDGRPVTVKVTDYRVPPVWDPTYYYDTQRWERRCAPYWDTRTYTATTSGGVYSVTWTTQAPTCTNYVHTGCTPEGSCSGYYANGSGALNQILVTTTGSEATSSLQVTNYGGAVTANLTNAPDLISPNGHYWVRRVGPLTAYPVIDYEGFDPLDEIKSPKRLALFNASFPDCDWYANGGYDEENYAAGAAICYGQGKTGLSSSWLDHDGNPSTAPIWYRGYLENNGYTHWEALSGGAGANSYMGTSNVNYTNGAAYQAMALAQQIADKTRGAFPTKFRGVIPGGYSGGAPITKSGLVHWCRGDWDTAAEVAYSGAGQILPNSCADVAGWWSGDGSLQGSGGPVSLQRVLKSSLLGSIGLNLGSLTQQINSDPAKEQLRWSVTNGCTPHERFSDRPEFRDGCSTTDTYRVSYLNWVGAHPVRSSGASPPSVAFAAGAYPGDRDPNRVLRDWYFSLYFYPDWPVENFSAGLMYNSSHNTTTGWPADTNYSENTNGSLMNMLRDFNIHGRTYRGCGEILFGWANFCVSVSSYFHPSPLQGNSLWPTYIPTWSALDWPDWQTTSTPPAKWTDYDYYGFNAEHTAPVHFTSAKMLLGFIHENLKGNKSEQPICTSARGVGRRAACRAPADEVAGDNIDNDGDELVDESPTFMNVRGPGMSAGSDKLWKSAPDGWNAGAVSVEAILAGQSGKVCFQAGSAGIYGYRMAGLSDGDLGQSYADIKFAVYLNNGSLNVYENGLHRGAFGAYAASDRFCVQISNNAVSYLKNGAVFYTSATAPTYPLRVDSSLYTNGTTLGNFDIDFFTMVPKMLVNLAQGKSCNAQSQYSTAYSCDKALDGDYWSRWASNRYTWCPSVSAPHWLQVDLGAVYNVTQVRFLLHQNGLTGNASVYHALSPSGPWTWGASYAQPGAGQWMSTATSATSRYWKVDVTSTTDNCQANVVELQVLAEPETTKVSGNATATASSVYPASSYYTPDKAIDGITTTDWASAYELAGAWIQLTLPTAKTVERVVLRDRPNPYEQVYGGTLYFSDGSTVPVGTLPDNGGPAAYELPGKVNITWVKFVVGPARGYNIGLSELEVWGY